MRNSVISGSYRMKFSYGSLKTSDDSNNCIHQVVTRDSWPNKPICEIQLSSMPAWPFSFLTRSPIISTSLSETILSPCVQGCQVTAQTETCSPEGREKAGTASLSSAAVWNSFQRLPLKFPKNEANRTKMVLIQNYIPVSLLHVFIRSLICGPLPKETLRLFPERYTRTCQLTLTWIETKSYFFAKISILLVEFLLLRMGQDRPAAPSECWTACVWELYADCMH